MDWFLDKKDDDRSHQDNFLSSYIDGEEWDNENYQYCPCCGKKVAFEWDRCTRCGWN